MRTPGCSVADLPAADGLAPSPGRARSLRLALGGRQRPAVARDQPAHRPALDVEDLVGALAAAHHAPLAVDVLARLGDVVGVPRERVLLPPLRADEVAHVGVRRPRAAARRRSWRRAPGRRAGSCAIFAAPDARMASAATLRPARAAAARWWIRRPALFHDSAVPTGGTRDDHSSLDRAARRGSAAGPLLRADDRAAPGRQGRLAGRALACLVLRPAHAARGR